VNGSAKLLAQVEAIRAHAAVAMGLADTSQQATSERPHSPKLCFVARSASYMASDGRPVAAASVDLLARVFSMGVLHHAMTGTGAVAIAVAAAIPSTIVHRAARSASNRIVRLGHPSGAFRVGAEVCRQGGRWVVTKVIMSRSARRLMEGWVCVPREPDAPQNA
jgi:2-methylaconitate cis-trans-isomerase PrpF